MTRSKSVSERERATEASGVGLGPADGTFVRQLERALAAEKIAMEGRIS
jgi:hypothetical protein